MNNPAEFSADDTLATAYLMPGGVLVASEPTRCTTILGSCVSVCLFDVFAGVGGINHFLLPGSPPAADAEPLRWSSSACAELYERVVSAGAARGRLQVKVFGGASVGVHRGGMRIGERNVEAAMAAVTGWRLLPVASDVGGVAGRKLVFETHSGRAWVKTLAHGTG